ncbi:MAG: L-threonylcarbamoyladenylate synthase [Patescibacteria group bacterium]
MQYLKINLKKIRKDEIDLAVDYLNKGKIIVYPTDTVYGLGCLANNQKAVNKIVKMKKRKDKNGLIILVKSYCMLHDYAYVNSKQDKYIRSIWPPTTRAAHDNKHKYNKKPTTFILKAKKKLAKGVAGNNNSQALRLPRPILNKFNIRRGLPKNDFLTTMLSVVNKPIVSTSLNVTNNKPLIEVKQIEKYFKKNKPDLVIEAGKIKATPSKIIDIRDVTNIKIIRK